MRSALRCLVWGIATAFAHAGGGHLVLIEDIQRRVTVAGGNAKGRLSISLSWRHRHDLDLHVETPSGARISYDHRDAGGGLLDVDMCARGAIRAAPASCAGEPRGNVENVVFKSKAGMREGRYAVFVRAFRRNNQQDPLGRRPTAAEEHADLPFEVLVALKGARAPPPRLLRGLCVAGDGVEDARGDGAASEVRVFEFVLHHGGSMEVLFAQGPMACAEQGRLAGGGGGGEGQWAGAGEEGGEEEEAAEGGGFDYAAQRERAKTKKKSKGQGRASAAGGRAKAGHQRYSAGELGAMRVGTLKRALKAVGGKCVACSERAQLVGALLGRQDELWGAAAADEL